MYTTFTTIFDMLKTFAADSNTYGTLITYAISILENIFLCYCVFLSGRSVLLWPDKNTQEQPDKNTQEHTSKPLRQVDEINNAGK